MTKQREFFDFFKIKTNLDYKYTFPIDLATDGFPYGGRSIGKL